MGEIIVSKQSDVIKLQHKNLKEFWVKQPITFQMANIGSEVSRALKNQNKPTRFQGAFDRALELFDLTIEQVARFPEKKGTLKELCRAREEFCDYFYGNNLKTDAVKMQRYYDQFAMTK